MVESFDTHKSSWVTSNMQKFPFTSKTWLIWNDFQNCNNARDELPINANIYFRVDFNGLIFQTTPFFFFFYKFGESKGLFNSNVYKTILSAFEPRVKLWNNIMSPKPSSMSPLIFNIVSASEDVCKYLHGVHSSEISSPKSHAALLSSHLFPLSPPSFE